MVKKLIYSKKNSKRQSKRLSKKNSKRLSKKNSKRLSKRNSKRLSKRLKGGSSKSVCSPNTNERLSVRNLIDYMPLHRLPPSVAVPECYDMEPEPECPNSDFKIPPPLKHARPLLLEPEDFKPGPSFFSTEKEYKAAITVWYKKHRKLGQILDTKLAKAPRNKPLEILEFDNFYDDNVETSDEISKDSRSSKSSDNTRYISEILVLAMCVCSDEIFNHLDHPLDYDLIKLFTYKIYDIDLTDVISTCQKHALSDMEGNSDKLKIYSLWIKALKNLKSNITKRINLEDYDYTWISGDNRADGACDILWVPKTSVCSPIAGISVKSVQATLVNKGNSFFGLTPGPSKVSDIWHILCPHEFSEFKKELATFVMDDCVINDSYGSKYKIEYLKDDIFRITTNKTVSEKTRSEIITLMSSNIYGWQRVFGDWFMEKKSELFKNSDIILAQLFKSLNTKFVPLCKAYVINTLSKIDNILILLQITNEEYIYLTPEKILITPSLNSEIDGVNFGVNSQYLDVRVDDISENELRVGACWNVTIFFNDGPWRGKNLATLTFWVRFANGFLGSAATIRGQNFIPMPFFYREL